MMTALPTTQPDALVCLLSDQPMPNLLSVHHFRPARLILVETAGMKQKKAADNFLEALALAGLDYRPPESHRIYPLAKQASFPDAAELFSAIAGDLEVTRRNVLVNLTGGTKVMSIAAYEVFRHAGARLIYTDADTPGACQGFPDGAETVYNHQPSCAEFLRAYGFGTKQSGGIPEARHTALWQAARAFVQVAGSQLPVQWQQNLDDKARNSRREELRKGRRPLEQGELLVEASLVAPLREVIAATISDGPRPVAITDDGSITGQPDQVLGRFLTGDWLDIFLAGLLRRHQTALNLWDVNQSVELRPVPGTPHGGARNEFDILFVRAHRLSVVECKSFMAHDREFEAVYKLDAVVHRSRALLTGIWFATMDRRVYSGDKKPAPDLDLGTPEPALWDTLDGRLKSLKCRLFSPHRLARLAHAGSPQEELALLGEAFE